MKIRDTLFEEMCSDENILLAFYKAAYGRKGRPDVAIVERNREYYFNRFRDDFINLRISTGNYHKVTIYEPKERNLYILPYYPDRIFQHTLMNILSPIWTNHLIHDTYACIPGRGTHAGIRRAAEFCRRNDYCLKCDISKFYPSIPHDKMMEVIFKSICDSRVLYYLEDIVYSINRQFGERTNVPIGNLTSQWFGNLYLNELDLYVKHVLKCKDYIRYCDDFLLFHNDKNILQEWKRKIREFCWNRLELRLSKCEVFPITNYRGIDFLGYVTNGRTMKVRKRTIRNIKKFLKNLDLSNDLMRDHNRSVISSYLGILKFANAKDFIEKHNLLDIARELGINFKRKRESERNVKNLIFTDILEDLSYESEFLF